jgi:hypothetical protein
VEHEVLMAANMVPERVAWAVEMLDLAPDDRLLEIGCGAGRAVSLICARLDTGTITPGCTRSISFGMIVPSIMSPLTTSRRTPRSASSGRRARSASSPARLLAATGT